MNVHTAPNQSLVSAPNLSAVNSSDGSLACPEGNFWEWLYTFQPIYIMVVCVTGVVGNSFVLMVLCLQKGRCTVPELYLGNLAGADLLLLAGLPFWAINIALHYDWPFGDFLCRYVNSVIYMNFYSSVYFLVMVSIDRYLALVKVLHYGRMRTLSCVKINCFIIWMFSLLMSSPIIIFRRVIYVEDLNISACLLDYPNKYWVLNVDILMVAIGFLIPAFILSFCTFQILKVLRNNQMQRFKQVHKESKAAILVLAVLLVFVICWLPFQLLRFLRIFLFSNILQGCSLERAISNSNQIASFLACTNSCINPVLYVLVGKQFRKKAREVWVRARSRSIQTLNDSVTSRTTTVKS
ncbi:B2 bradykinin receptor-like [Chiloscyllium plagiosum]|uniref:B2 bradykinin receptor-like n=1 Tax=Chiloscyllium plagiosum TaxID=36176 RepID=UPI001CB7CDC4|nr:B2 bradykinin receptor-like [Chiloscyllium plagiosum]XP_043554384.1 B2 bradykinin receptor-like [Chiloscyllium plagiosum]